MLQKITTGLAIVALVIIGIFSIQNLGKVPVSFLTWSVDVPMIVVILGGYLLGMLTGSSLIGLVKRYFRKSKETKSKASNPKESEPAEKAASES